MRAECNRVFRSKAISPVIAVVLLSLLAISVVILVANFFFQATEQVSSKGQRAIKSGFESMIDFEIDAVNVEDEEIYVRIEREVDVKAREVSVYVNEEEVSPITVTRDGRILTIKASGLKSALKNGFNDIKVCVRSICKKVKKYYG